MGGKLTLVNDRNSAANVIPSHDEIGFVHATQTPQFHPIELTDLQMFGSHVETESLRRLAILKLRHLSTIRSNAFDVPDDVRPLRVLYDSYSFDRSRSVGSKALPNGLEDQVPILDSDRHLISELTAC